MLNEATQYRVEPRHVLLLLGERDPTLWTLDDLVAVPDLPACAAHRALVDEELRVRLKDCSTDELLELFPQSGGTAQEIIVGIIGDRRHCTVDELCGLLSAADFGVRSVIIGTLALRPDCPVSLLVSLFEQSDRLAQAGIVEALAWRGDCPTQVLVDLFHRTQDDDTQRAILEVLCLQPGCPIDTLLQLVAAGEYFVRDVLLDLLAARSDVRTDQLLDAAEDAQYTTSQRIPSVARFRLRACSTEELIRLLDRPLRSGLRDVIAGALTSRLSFLSVREILDLIATAKSQDLCQMATGAVSRRVRHLPTPELISLVMGQPVPVRRAMIDVLQPRFACCTVEQLLEFLQTTDDLGIHQSIMAVMGVRTTELELLD